MELELSGVKYRTGRLNAFKQLHLARKVGPIIMGLGRSAEDLKQLFAEESPAETTGTELANPGMAFKAIGPIVDVISAMKEEDVNAIFQTCLSVVERFDSGKWFPVQNAQGQLMYQTEIQLPEMVQLAMAVAKENLGSFFAGGGAGSG